MSEDWTDPLHGSLEGFSETELYVATANTLDHIFDKFKSGELGRKPTRALVFILVDDEQNVTLFQAGSVHDVIDLASTAANQAMIAGKEAWEEAQRDGEDQ